MDGQPTRRDFMAASGGALAAGLPAQAQTGWKAGAAKVVITPSESIWMAGYAARNRPSEGVQTDLYVKTLALQDESGTTSVIVTSDLIGFRRELSDTIAERCLKQFRLPRERLLLNASHTHSGPTVGEFNPRPPYEAQKEVVRRYTAGLLDKVVEAAGASIRDLAPATVEFGQGLAGFAVNRRRDRPHMRHLPGPVDQDVPVLRVRGVDGGLRAVLFGYACHNTTLGAYQINADYAGYAQHALEAAHPGVVALFMQGCGADANPLPRYQGTDPALTHYSVELATMYGRILGTAVDLALHGKMAPVSGPLAAGFERVDVPYHAPPTREQLEAQLKERDASRRSQAERLLRVIQRDGALPASYAYPVQVLRFGRGLKLIALGGEVVVDYSLRIKAQHGWEDTWVAAYSNDGPGYIPSLRVLKEGDYEARGGISGPFAAAVEEIIIEKVNDMVQRTA